MASSAAVLTCAQCDLQFVGKPAGICTTCAADNAGNGCLCAACVEFHGTVRLFKAHSFEKLASTDELCVAMCPAHPSMSIERICIFSGCKGSRLCCSLCTGTQGAHKGHNFLSIDDAARIAPLAAERVRIEAQLAGISLASAAAQTSRPVAGDGFVALIDARRRRSVGLRRASLDRSVAPLDSIDWAQPGRYFRFVNRESECLRILQALCDLEDIRATEILGGTGERWSALVRRTSVVSLTGMPGIGKTAAARLALHHLARKACGSDAPESILATAGALASRVQRPVHGAFVRSLLRACLSDRNLRIDFSRLDTSAAVTQSDIALSLLQEWGKYTPGFPAACALLGPGTSLLDAVRLILDEGTSDPQLCTANGAVSAHSARPIVGPVKKSSARIPTRFPAASADATAAAAAPAAATSSADLLDDRGPPCLIVNLDEAHTLEPRNLGSILRSFVGLLINHQLRVFVIVTGVTSEGILAAFDDSHVRATSISLPLLDLDHVVQVAETLLPLPLGSSWRAAPVLMHALWWTGGVPRTLETLVRIVAERTPLTVGESRPSRAAVALSLLRMSWVDGSSLVEAMAAHQFSGHGGSGVSIEYTDALREAFSFALLETPVSSSHVLAQLTRPITVDDAQKHSVLYWCASGASTASLGGPGGRIVLPPLSLFAVQRALVPSLQHLYLVKYIVPFMSARDNKSVAVGALMHKFLALAVIRTASVTLADLGMPVRSSKSTHNPTVRLPSCFDVVRTEGNVTAANFLALSKRVRSVDAALTATTPVAFVNAPTAPFADAFIVLPDFVIFVQERQRVLARLRRAQGGGGASVGAAGCSERAVTFAEVTAEYDKLGRSARAQPHVFLYITDDGQLPATQLAGLPAAVLVADASAHPQLLGRMCAHLRRQSLAWSAVDAGSAAVGLATAAAPC
jgi:hypothetical protein